MTKIADYTMGAIPQKMEPVKAPGNVTSEKFNDWVYRLWVTSPSSYPVNEFYQRFREYLWEMYISQKPEEDEGKH